MMHDFVFWDRAKCRLKPKQIIDAFRRGECPEGLSTLDTAKFRRTLESNWGAGRSDNGAVVYTVPAGGAVRVDASDAIVLCNCDGMSPDDMNIVIEAAQRLGWDFYDVQMDEEF